MARNLQPKTVQCYHCDHRFEVGGRAQSTSCPSCNKPLIVADQEIAGQRGPIRELKTCGQIIVKKRGRLICQHIVAHNGLINEGIIDAKQVESRTKVTLGAKSTFKGDLTAPAVDIIDGAKIQPSFFTIGELPDGVSPSDPKPKPPPDPPPESGPTTPRSPAPKPPPKAPPMGSTPAAPKRPSNASYSPVTLNPSGKRRRRK